MLPLGEVVFCAGVKAKLRLNFAKQEGGKKKTRWRLFRLMPCRRACVCGIEALTWASFVTAPPDYLSPILPVFECAYAQLVLPWYDGAELCLRQPLHQVLSREVDAIIERVIQRARDFNVCQAVVGSIRILSQHLRNTKQPDR